MHFRGSAPGVLYRLNRGSLPETAHFVSAFSPHRNKIVDGLLTGYAYKSIPGKFIAAGQIDESAQSRAEPRSWGICQQV
jgi:hypothetical protein